MRTGMREYCKQARSLSRLPLYRYMPVQQALWGLGGYYNHGRRRHGVTELCSQLSLVASDPRADYTVASIESRSAQLKLTRVPPPPGPPWRTGRVTHRSPPLDLRLQLATHAAAHPQLGLPQLSVTRSGHSSVCPELVGPQPAT